ncbi:hypothetical protein FRC08_007872, partial [Ceratobasidium sp. 394]
DVYCLPGFLLRINTTLAHHNSFSIFSCDIKRSPHSHSPSLSTPPQPPAKRPAAAPRRSPPPPRLMALATTIDSTTTARPMTLPPSSPFASPNPDHSSAASHIFMGTNSSDLTVAQTMSPRLPGARDHSEYGLGFVHRSTRQLSTHKLPDHTAVRQRLKSGLVDMAEEGLHDSDNEHVHEHNRLDPTTDLTHNAEIRRQHIVQSERRRRDNLREGFARLKETLPASTEKHSKLNLLDRAATYVRYLQGMLQQTQDKLTASEVEVAHLRQHSATCVLAGAGETVG